MDEIVLVTGASRGIGSATAKLLALNGYMVVVNYLKEKVAADEVVAGIVANGGKAIALQADVSVESEIVSLFEKIDEQPGRLVGLVNNAGVLETQGRVEDFDSARLELVFRVNVISCFLCCRQAVQRMSTKNGGLGGAIVNVSSIAAVTGSPNEYVDYAASKGAVDTFSRGLASEVADEGIRVNAVRPGFIETDIHASGGDPDRLKRIAGNIPLKRSGQPLEVAESILWLLSAKSSYTTGGFIDIAGGR